MMLQAPGHRNSIASPENSGVLLQTFHSDEEDGDDTDHESSQSSFDDNVEHDERKILFHNSHQKCAK